MKKAKIVLAWPFVWAIEWAVMLLLGTACIFLPVLIGPYSLMYILGFYIVLPLGSALAAYVCVRHGLAALIAWIAPVASFVAAHIFWMEPLPSIGSVLVLFILALLGASAAEVVAKRK